MSCGFGSLNLDRSVQGSIISQTLDQLSKDETWAWQLSRQRPMFFWVYGKGEPSRLWLSEDNFCGFVGWTWLGQFMYE